MAITKNRFTPIEAIHPSELIKDELKARGMQKKELAERLGMKAPNLSRLLNAKENITSAMALKLEDAFGIPADYWMGLQLEYDRDIEAIRLRDEAEIHTSQVEKALSAMLNLPVLFKKLGLDGFSFFRDRLDALYGLFHVSDMESLLSLSTAQGCFKKSDRLETEQKNLATWILIARQSCESETEELGCYEKGNENKAAEEIAALANKQEISEKDIKSILSRHGIGYCVVEKFEKTPVDAYSVMIGNNPFIVVSHRRNNMDMLVFDVLHECGHINLHLKENLSFVSYNQDMDGGQSIEQEANRYAMDMLIPPSVWASIKRGKSQSLNPFSLIKAITEEASRRCISPTIAAWRFKHETGNYKIPGYKSKPIK